MASTAKVSNHIPSYTSVVGVYMLTVLFDAVKNLNLDEFMQKQQFRGVFTRFIYLFIYLFSHLADAFIQSDLQMRTLWKQSKPTKEQ